MLNLKKVLLFIYIVISILHEILCVRCVHARGPGARREEWGPVELVLYTVVSSDNPTKVLFQGNQSL